VISGVPQGSVLAPILFLIFVNDLDCGVFNLLLKFADDTKLFGKVQSELDRACLQQDLQRLLDWSMEWQMEFSVEKMQSYAYWRHEQELSVPYGSEGIGGGRGRKGPWGANHKRLKRFTTVQCNL